LSKLTAPEEARDPAVRLEAAESRLAAGEAIDDEVLDLMEAVTAVAGTRGATWLVERFGGSPVPLMTRSVSFMLTQLANRPGPGSAPLVYALIGRLASTDEPTLINCCTTIHRQAAEGMPWYPPEAPPRRVLPPFVTTCLRQSILVVSSALGMLQRLLEDGVLDTVFVGDDRTTLRQEIARLVESGDPDVLADLGDLADLR
jgi:hypothetical protein